MDLSSGLLIGRVRGIAIRVHWSWIFIFTLVTWSLATGFFESNLSSWSTGARWTGAILTSLAFFLSVLLHELSHAFVAQHYRMRVPSITLFIFGGVSNIDGEMQSARQEFFIAAAGPLMSFVLAVILTVAGAILGTGGPGLVMLYLGLINFILGLFNLLPGFPLDGGRVFRSIVWARTHDLARSTRIAANVGSAIAWVMIVVGILIVFTVSLVGLWYVLIGLFLKQASEAAYQQMVVERTLQGVVASEVMRPPPEALPETTTLDRIVEDRILTRGERCVLLERDGHVTGLLTTSDLARVSRDRLTETHAADVMVRAEDVLTVTPRTAVVDAMRTMAEHDVHQLPVLEDGRLVGILTRGDILQQLENRMRFQRAARSA